MKQSLILLASTVGLAFATPLDRRALVTKYETVTVTRYVYPDGSLATVEVNQNNGVYVDLPTEDSDNPSQTEQPETTHTSDNSSPTTQPLVITTKVITATETTFFSPSTTSKGDEAITTTTTTSEQASEPTSDSDYVSTVLHHHNIHRSNHSSPDLSWDDTLASYALITANKCVMAHDMDVGTGHYGQNLAMFGSTGDSGDAKFNAARGITNQWYNGELPIYPGFGAEPDMTLFKKWGHFSQLVWKSTSLVGCATISCPQGTLSDDMPAWITVCNYRARGNVDKAYTENVLAPLGEPQVTV